MIDYASKRQQKAANVIKRYQTSILGTLRLIKAPCGHYVTRIKTPLVQSYSQLKVPLSAIGRFSDVAFHYLSIITLFV